MQAKCYVDPFADAAYRLNSLHVSIPFQPIPNGLKWYTIILIILILFFNFIYFYIDVLQGKTAPLYI